MRILRLTNVHEWPEGLEESLYEATQGEGFMYKQSGITYLEISVSTDYEAQKAIEGLAHYGLEAEMEPVH